jgi:ribose transport system ATP-binding protein
MTSTPVLQFKHISKQFPGVQALNGVDFDLYRGEVHVLVGANGAGKSTLVKILAGVYRPEEGEIFFDGRPVSIKGPDQALEMGISIVYQNFNLINKMDVAQNIFLNREPTKGKLIKRIDWARIYSETEAVLKRLHVDIDPRKRVGDLAVADHQMIEIAKALAFRSRILVLDEPTSSLSEQETEELFERISKLRGEGVAIIYISHRMEEIKRIGDRVTVFRDGERVGTESIDDLTFEKIIKMMLGRDIESAYPWKPRPAGEEILSVEDLSLPGVFEDVNFTLRKGEILGISGLLGARRTEVVHAIFGALPVESGRVICGGRLVEFKSPGDAIRAGIGLLAEDRKKHGMFSILSVANNITSAGLKLLRGRIGLRIRKEREVSKEFVDKLNIRTPSVDTNMESLSGGNQQKVVLAKSLFTNSEILIFDEPTKGIDVGAKEEIYNLMLELAGAGKGIIMISSELPEILGMSDRVLVMREGRITAEMSRQEASQERVLEAAL